MKLPYKSLIDLMPNTEQDKQILEERARILSQSDCATFDVIQDNYYVRFILGEEYYGVPFQYIKEVMLYTTYTKVPNTPPYIAGIINRNGMLVSVVDLKPFFHIKMAEELLQQAHLIVISIKGITCALLADTIIESCDFDPKLLEAPLTSKQAIKAKYILGLDKGVTSILNPEMLLPDLQFKKSFTKEGNL